MSAFEPSQRWEEERQAQAHAFRKSFQVTVDALPDTIDLSSFGPHAEHSAEVSFALGRSSQHWFTLPLSWGMLCTLLEAQIETAQKDHIILCPGPLTGGKTEAGTRKIKEHVEGLDLVVLDFDKGDAPLEKLEARLIELGLEGAAYATFSHLKAETSLAWSVTRPNPKSGQVETLKTAFQNFVRARLSVEADAALEPSHVTPEVFMAYMVEQQGFDPEILGTVTIVPTNKIEQARIRVKDGTWHTQKAHNLVAKHNPLAKSRLVLPLARRFARRPAESAASFQKRWQEEVYFPIGRLIGFHFDETCASIERGHYAMTRRVGREPVPLCHTCGRLLDLDDAETQTRLAPFKVTARQKPSARAKHSEGNCSVTSHDWRGFKAADAAADLLSNVTDKRRDEENPLVAFPCPFVHEHATSNNPDARQCYAYNAAAVDKLPTVKCRSDTCRDRPYGEFLDALFDEIVKSDPAYRVTEDSIRSGIRIEESELPTVLRAINQTWAVVQLGNRVRYLHETADGDLELYDSKSLADWFGNWIYLYYDAHGGLREAAIIKAWQKWEFRRQYRGVRFCPEPEGPPEGVYNSYYGFTVKPQPGSWKRLLGHIYRNICRRDPVYFRFFIAWLAQLVQEPHIKPGTNIVLKGKEGVGKSKVGEWVVALFGRNAMIVSEAERITGRFNAHLENKLLLMAEEAFWAGDKSAEGKLKDLATGALTSYERKGLDPYEGKNYTRIMIASNEDWVVPASSGGRRWFVLEVGDEHEKDHAYFAAIDEEMKNGGLAAMLHDLLRTKLPQQVNVRDAPVTRWLVEQRLHSYDNKRRWWRGVLIEGGLRDNASGTFIELNEDTSTVARRDDVFASARPYFLGPKGVDPNPSEIGQFMSKMLGKLHETRPTIEGKRQRCYILPSLREMRQRWCDATGEAIEPDHSPEQGQASAPEVGQKVLIGWDAPSFDEELAYKAIAAAVDSGVTDDHELGAVAARAIKESRRSWPTLVKAVADKTCH